jgi:hypothetical protein
VSPLVEITVLGAFIPGDEERPARYVRRGAEVDVNEETAERFIARGFATLAGEDVAAEQAVTTEPAGPAKPIEKMTAAEVRAFAAAHDPAIVIPADVKKVADLRLFVARAVASGGQENPADPNADEAALPAVLADLTDDELLELAGRWEIEPGDADREHLLALLTAHRATLNTGETHG